MDIFRKLEIKAKKKFRTIILPESYDKRVIEAVRLILRKGLARVILIENGKKINIPEHKSLDIIDIGFSGQFAAEYLKIRRKKNPFYSPAIAEKDLRDPLIFACMLLRKNFAHAVVAGSVYNTGAVIRNAINIVGLSKKNRTVSSFFLFYFNNLYDLFDFCFGYDFRRSRVSTD